MNLKPSTVCNHLDDFVQYTNYFMHFRGNRDKKHVIGNGGGAGAALMIRSIRKSCKKQTNRCRSWKTVEVSNRLIDQDGFNIYNMLNFI